MSNTTSRRAVLVGAADRFRPRRARRAFERFALKERAMSTDQPSRFRPGNAKREPTPSRGRMECYGGILIRRLLSGGG
jgi:hypothetical protein